MSETAPYIRFTQTFKKYTEEYEPKVVEFVREWARAQGHIVWHEDHSIIKVTGSRHQIDELLGVLKERFSYIPPEQRKAAAKEKGD